MFFVDTTFATSPTTLLLSGATLSNNLKYVNNNIHSFILLPSFALSFIHIYVLTPFFKLDVADAGRTPTTRSHTRNSRGIAGFFRDHVVNEKGEYHVKIDIDLRC